MDVKLAAAAYPTVGLVDVVLLENVGRDEAEQQANHRQRHGQAAQQAEAEAQAETRAPFIGLSRLTLATQPYR